MNIFLLWWEKVGVRVGYPCLTSTTGGVPMPSRQRSFARALREGAEAAKAKKQKKQES